MKENTNTIIAKNNNYLVKLDNIQKKIGENTIITDLSLFVQKHDRLTLFAPSGYGKTTLLSIIAGLDDHFSGTMEINVKNIAMVFQEPRLFAYKTVKENILYPLLKTKKVVDKVLFEKWLEITGLKVYQNYYPYQISGGMKQMAAIIRAFIVNPDLVLLDEPLKSIDIGIKKTIASFIKDNYTSAILMVTHAIDEIALLSQTMLFFQNKPLSRYETINLKDNSTVDIMNKIIKI